MKDCNICERKELVYAEDNEELFYKIMDMVNDDEDGFGINVVADAETVKELLYYAINEEHKIATVEINAYDYDGPYIFSISWNDDCENFEVDVETARLSDGYYKACAGLTLVQCNLPERCEYVQDVTENKYVTWDIQMFGVGDMIHEDYIQFGDEDDEDGDEMYTYANEYKDKDGVAGMIFVSSNLKEFVNMVKDEFEDVFLDD